tara:strand:+ start:9420 stop:9611 length:192 start_codon:yes stop_codon:yes gene_type:complete
MHRAIRAIVLKVFHSWLTSKVIPIVAGGEHLGMNHDGTSTLTFNCAAEEGRSPLHGVPSMGRD